MARRTKLTRRQIKISAWAKLCLANAIELARLAAERERDQREPDAWWFV